MKHSTTLISYIVGFILSLIFTIIPYYLVTNQLLSSDILTAIVLGFAMLQLLIQLIFFLHLGEESGPRWNFIMLISTFGIILLIVVGSIWIMNNLNYNMMPQHMEEFLIEDEGIHVNDATNH